MIIRKVAWSSCVLVALLLGGCMMDATGSGDEDGLLAVAGEQLDEGVPLPPSDELVPRGEGDNPVDPPPPPDTESGVIPTPGDAVSQDYDPNEPHPDPWRVAAPVGAGHKD